MLTATEMLRGNVHHNTSLHSKWQSQMTESNKVMLQRLPQGDRDREHGGPSDSKRSNALASLIRNHRTQHTPIAPSLSEQVFRELDAATPYPPCVNPNPLQIPVRYAAPIAAHGVAGSRHHCCRHARNWCSMPVHVTPDGCGPERP